MGSEHKRPLYGFVVLAIAAAFALVGVARSDAVGGHLRDRVVVVAGQVIQATAPTGSHGELAGTRDAVLVATVAMAAPWHQAERHDPRKRAAHADARNDRRPAYSHAVRHGRAHVGPLARATAHGKPGGHPKAHGHGKGHGKGLAQGHAKAHGKSHAKAQAKGHGKGPCKGHGRGLHKR